MRALLFTGLAVLLFGCNNAKDTKDPNQAMDDTARMRDLPLPPAILFNRVILMETEIPSVIKVKGKIIEASKWTDKQGENFLVLSSEGPFDSKSKDEEDGQTTELYAAHYVQKGNDYPKIWSIKDAVVACPFDITSKFIPGSTTITDLDKDSTGEIKLQWLSACRSDVSPAMMMLVLAENGESYRLTGQSWIQYSPEFKFNVTEKDVNLENLPKLKDETETMLREFGRYRDEKQFAAAPPEFIAYARKEWLKHVMERMGE
jgi:hypothetical protein